MMLKKEEMYKQLSNKVIGYINLVTLLSSIPIIGAAIWFACCSSPSSSSCESSFQTPLLILGFFVLLVSLAGLVGACFNLSWVLCFYLSSMFLLITFLLCITAFGFIVTGNGGGTLVPGRVYLEYRLEAYSGWLRNRVSQDEYWKAARECVVSSGACTQLATWTPFDYSHNDLTPVQSGCCKPPTSCTYAVPVVKQDDEDCYRWSNEEDKLCYDCDSCKAGVLEQVRRNWHNLSVFNVVLIFFLIGVYSIGCCAFHNARSGYLLWSKPFVRG